jgi:acetyl-CoA acetyltransferase
MIDAFIYSGSRTAFGKHGAVFATIRPDDLRAHTLQEVVTSSGIDAAMIDDVVIAVPIKPVKMRATSRGMPRFWPAFPSRRPELPSIVSAAVAYPRLLRRPA